MKVMQIKNIYFALVLTVLFALGACSKVVDGKMTTVQQIGDAVFVNGPVLILSANQASSYGNSTSDASIGAELEKHRQDFTDQLAGSSIQVQISKSNFLVYENDLTKKRYVLNFFEQGAYAILIDGNGDYHVYPDATSMSEVKKDLGI
jgi:hypothetical protein